MSNCAIPGCPHEAVAKGLCAKHYMRLRRAGDPMAKLQAGRKAQSDDPELAAIRREVLALREEVATWRRIWRRAKRWRLNPRSTRPRAPLSGQ